MRNYEAAPVGDTAAALIENANGDVDDAIETAEFMRKKTESQIEKARQDAEEAEDPETHQDIKNRIKEMEGHVKYWDDVVKFLEDVKKGAEVQAEEEAKAEAEANVPVEENTPAEGAEEAKEDVPSSNENEETQTPEASEENAPNQEDEAKAPEANEEKGADEGENADNKAAESENTTPKELVDNQGNPINDDGSLKLDKIDSIDELTDEDFSNPTRNVQLPKLRHMNLAMKMEVLLIWPRNGLTKIWFPKTIPICPRCAMVLHIPSVRRL